MFADVLWLMLSAHTPFSSGSDTFTPSAGMKWALLWVPAGPMSISRVVVLARRCGAKGLREVSPLFRAKSLLFTIVDF
jgi:hypothetical protein